jgi:hypothetical protein
LEFPICSLVENFKKNAWKIKPLSPERRAVIESVQPYNTPELDDPRLLLRNFNRNLRILNDWARIDRHRRLHVVMSWASNVNPKVRIPEGTTLVYLNPVESCFLENESKVANFKIEGWRPYMDMQANPDLFIDIAVDEVPPRCADNDTFGNRVAGMIETVTNIVATFEKL